MITRYSHKIISVAVIICLSVHSHAQLFTNNKLLVFHSYNSVQALMGKTNNSASVHSVNGVQLNKMFAGIGLGFDYYYHTSVPLFLELRCDITNKQKKLQAFVDGGLHLPFGNINKVDRNKTGDFRSGRLLAAGFDYYIPVKKNAFILGVAYSQKKMTQMVDNNIWNPSVNHVENVPVKEVYEFNRIWLKMGWVF